MSYQNPRHHHTTGPASRRHSDQPDVGQGDTAVGCRGDRQAVEDEAGADVIGVYDAMGSSSGWRGWVAVN